MDLRELILHHSGKPVSLDLLEVKQDRLQKIHVLHNSDKLHSLHIIKSAETVL